MSDNTKNTATVDEQTVVLSGEGMVERAVSIATEKHDGQTDKAGAPYVQHPLRVMEAMPKRNHEARAVAALHDVIEDTDMTLDDLRHEGFPEEVIAAIDAISRKKGEGYSEYIERLAKNDLARMVKEADLEDNLDVSRLPEDKRKEHDSLSRRYTTALVALHAEDKAKSLEESRISSVMKWFEKDIWHKVIGIMAVIIVFSMLLIGVKAMFGRNSSIAIPTSEGITLMKKGTGVEKATMDDAQQSISLDLKKEYIPKDSPKGFKGAKTVTFDYSRGQVESLSKMLDSSTYKKGYTVILTGESILSYLIKTMLPMLLILGAMLYLIKSGALVGTTNPQKDNNKSSKPKETFKDVAGEDMAVTELREMEDMFSHPAKYDAIGAKPVHGILLYGPPGTGKTLLARAFAGSTDAHFIHASASEFVQMFVGLGASRVRDLFKEARKHRRSVIFIDEIDAVAGARGGHGDSNSEREQTLNQLLTCMDGFESSDSIMVIGATNRIETLDPAILRDGRFSRKVSVDMPDKAGRRAILDIHSRNKPLGKEVNLDWVASQTTGFSGAKLESVMNEAALMAVRAKRESITFDDISEAIDRVMMGPSKKGSRSDYRKALERTAVHESGHALVAMSLKKFDRGGSGVSKITVVPRSNALGYTSFAQEDDRTNWTLIEIKATIAAMFGGLVAEEMEYGKERVSTGPSDDLRKATSLARDAITSYGFGQSYAVWQEQDGTMAASQGTIDGIDKEIESWLHEGYETARKVLSPNTALLRSMSGILLEKETINPDGIHALMERIVAPADISDTTENIEKKD